MGKYGNFEASFSTNEGFEIPCEITNDNELTYILWESWKEFVRVYTLHVGQEITFSTDNSEVPSSVVRTGNLPIIHPSKILFCSCKFITLTLSYTIYNKLNCMCYNIVAYYQLSNEKRDIIDNVTVTEGTSLNWRMMEYVIRQVMDLDKLVERHDAGNYDQGRAYAFLHMLTWSDCNKNFSVTIFLFFIYFVSFQYVFSFVPN